MFITEFWDGPLCIEQCEHVFQEYAEEWLAKAKWEYLNNPRASCEVVEETISYVVLLWKHPKFGERTMFARWYDADNPPLCECCAKKLQPNPRITSQYQS